ncbi:hypothetical protein BASA83_011829 [Batrachochytrium salamandrivorans]|nr:hypothetical protein BASA83_011829 [Batrachochytrium salamandrivorans]
MKCFTFLALCWLALSSQAVNIPHSHDAQYDAADSASDVQQDGGLDEQVQSVSLPEESLVQVSEEEDPEEGVSGERVSEEEESEEEVFEEEKSEEGVYEELLRKLNEELAVARKSRKEAVEAQPELIDEYKYTRTKWPFIVGAYSNSATRITTPKKDHSQQALHMRAIYNSVRKKNEKLEQRLEDANIFDFVAARQIEQLKAKIRRVKNHK